MASNTAPDIVPEANGAPFLCGALWGLGLGLAITFTWYFTTSFGLVSAAVIFVLGPAICLASVVALGLWYRTFARTQPHVASERFQLAALAGALVLAGLPWAVETLRLYSIARFDFPVYPESRRLETHLEHHPAAKITVIFSSDAPKRDVLAFYDRELRARKWSTDANPSYSFAAQKANYVLFVYVREAEREIEIQWYRHFANH
jgi:hypothetical protein